MSRTTEGGDMESQHELNLMSSASFASSYRREKQESDLSSIGGSLDDEALVQVVRALEAGESEPEAPFKEGGAGDIEQGSDATTTIMDSMEQTEQSKRFSQKFSGKYEVPLVEIKLEGVTYAPVVKTYGATPGKGGAKAPPGSGHFRKGGDGKFRKEILSNISTTIRPGKLTAWMGPSGSGKTSCLSVVAGLVPRDDIMPDSRILVNGARGRIPKRLVGVVWQDDLLLSNLTVEENIYFAARMKTPKNISNADVNELVQEVMSELGLLHIRHSLVGSPMGPIRGVSGGERKRVSVASELVVRPSLLMLDEPTSGLDATTAQSLMATLKELAALGHSVAVVIHQPRTEIYNMFDHLLLLSKGHVIFDGKPSKARTYLESCPTVHALPPETGIADWMMDVVIEDERRKGGGKLAQHWENYGDDRALLGEKTPRRLSSKLKDLEELHNVPKYNVGFLTQLALLTKRTMKQQRGERITSATIILQFLYLVFTALFWWRPPDNTAYVFTRDSLFFFMMIAQSNGIVVNSVAVFQRERTLLRRERAKKMYGVASYFIAKTVSDMSTNVMLPMVYLIIAYWICGYRPEFVAFLKFLLAFYLTLSTAQSMGLFMSIAIPNNQLSLILAPPITLFFMVMGGFYVPFANMPNWIRWISWLSLARYGYSAAVINEYGGRDIPCAPGNVTAVSVGSTNVCPLPGQDVISGLGLYGVAQYYWFNAVMLLVLQVVFRFAAYALLRKAK